MGFQLAVCAADGPWWSVLPTPPPCGTLQRTVALLRGRISRIHLVVNRVQPRLLQAPAIPPSTTPWIPAGLPLLGVVPEDPQVMLCANRGEPLILAASRGAAVAYLNIAKRLLGQRPPLMKLK